MYVIWLISESATRNDCSVPFCNWPRVACWYVYSKHLGVLCLNNWKYLKCPFESATGGICLLASWWGKGIQITQPTASYKTEPLANKRPYPECLLHRIYLCFLSGFQNLGSRASSCGLLHLCVFITVSFVQGIDVEAFYLWDTSSFLYYWVSNWSTPASMVDHQDCYFLVSEFLFFPL